MSDVLSIEKAAIVLNADDNVAVARRLLTAGMRILREDASFPLVDSIRPGHKFAIEPMAEGEGIRKYGQIIGFASSPIEQGAHVHCHNVACHEFDRDHASATAIPPPPVPQPPRTFSGYLRDDGRVGTRNYIAVVSTVNCSASTVSRIVSAFTPERLRSFPRVDGVFGVTHKSGCGIAESGLDRTYVSRCLAGFARHPNVFAYILVGLGCEVNQASQLIEIERLTGRGGARPRVLTVQGSGGIAKTVELGIAAVQEMLPLANEARRSPQPLSQLILGTNCGGSDAYSGITANPALGLASDRLIAHGGTSILAETTEIYGAEHLLTRRAVSQKVAQKLIDRIHWWEWYTSLFGARINNNPSFGNKEGGLTTIYEKSLGAVAKGGSSALSDVVGYAEAVRGPGLVVMDTPGFDPVSVTGIVAGGANVVVFTTGRGSVLGCKPAPTIKVATTRELYRQMEADMDIDAGTILEGVPIEVVGSRIFEEIIQVASGQKTKSELQGVGDDEFAPWLVGPVL